MNKLILSGITSLILCINSEFTANTQVSEEDFVKNVYEKLAEVYYDSTYSPTLKDENIAYVEQIHKSKFGNKPITRIRSVFTKYPIASELILFLYYSAKYDDDKACTAFKQSHSKYKELNSFNRSKKLPIKNTYKGQLGIDLDREFKKFLSSSRMVEELKCIKKQKNSTPINEGEEETDVDHKEDYFGLLMKYFEEDPLKNKGIVFSEAPESYLQTHINALQYTIELSKKNLISQFQFDAEKFIYKKTDSRYQELQEKVRLINYMIEDFVTLTERTDFFQIFIQGEADQPEFDSRKIDKNCYDSDPSKYINFIIHNPINTDRKISLSKYKNGYKPQKIDIKNRSYNNDLLPDLRARSIQIFFEESTYITQNNLSNEFMIVSGHVHDNGIQKNKRLATIIFLLDKEKCEEIIDNISESVLKNRKKKLHILKLLQK